jgi:hypothetical protein
VLIALTTTALGRNKIIEKNKYNMRNLFLVRSSEKAEIFAGGSIGPFPLSEIA